MNYKLTLTAILCAACMAGCSKPSEEEIALAGFSASMQDYANYMKDADQKINGLDVSKKESVEELLSTLDGMNEETAKLAALDVPAQYAGIKNPVSMAADNMSYAVSYYHSAFENGGFSKEDADAAYQYYQASMKCINIIGCVIAGDEIPQDDDVTVYEENNDERLFDKWFDEEPAEEYSSAISE